jgi:hypothetical protein
MMKVGAVAFLDILGFKGIWNKRKPEEVIKDLEEIVIHVKNIDNYKPFKNDLNTGEAPQITILSDTIVLYYEDKKRIESVFDLGRVINAIFGIFLKKKLLIRGALGYGEFQVSGNSLLGPAVDDVATWYESSKIIGAVTTPRTNYLIDCTIPKTIHYCWMGGNRIPIFLKYPVPLKGAHSQNNNCANWPAFQNCHAQI